MQTQEDIPGIFPPATPPEFRDERPKRRKPANRGRFSPEYVQLFIRWVTGRVFSHIAGYRYYGRPTTDVLEYCPASNVVFASVERIAIGDQFKLDEGQFLETRLAEEVTGHPMAWRAGLWMPSDEALSRAPDRSEFLRRVAEYRTGSGGSALPQHIANHPEYVEVCERILAEPGQYSSRPLWELARNLHVDIEKLTVPLQAEIVESRLVNT